MALTVGTYLQDGRQLYSFQCWLPREGGVVLENCTTNALISISLKEFAKAGFRKVR